VRRFSRILIGAAGALLIAPLVVAAQALPASAATGKLLVTTLDRKGHAVTSSITVSTYIRNAAGLPTWTTSGKTISVADGKYVVLAGIEQTVNGTTVGTLAETTVTVSGTGTTRVTLDARKGRLIKVTLNGKPVNDYVDARVCVGSSPSRQELFESPGDLYVVPSTSSLYSFAYLAQGQGAVITAVTQSGIPASPGGSWKSSQLAKVTLHVRSNEQLGSSTSATLQPEPPNGGVDCGTDLGATIVSNVAPYSESWQVSPDYWDVRTDDILNSGFDIGGYEGNQQRFTAGHSYSDTYYAAAWAPSAVMYTYILRRSLNFTPPSFTDPNNQGFESGTLNHLDLSLNGHLLASDKVDSYGRGLVTPIWQVGIKSAGWYTLTDTTTPDSGGRLPSGLLSTKATLAWRFYASPSDSEEAPGFWTSFAPGGLSDTNSAKPGSSTTVIIRPSRDSSNPNVPAPSDSVTKLQAWWSSDGVHWHALAVHHNASGWYVQVHNPGTKGDVSLRAEVTGSHGDTSTETVTKAYAVS
jgi:hypothetical protein